MPPTSVENVAAAVPSQNVATTGIFENVVAGPAEQAIVAPLAVELVVAAASADGVAACSALDRLGSGSPDEIVVAWRALDLVEVRIAIATKQMPNILQKLQVRNRLEAALVARDAFDRPDGGPGGGQTKV